MGFYINPPNGDKEDFLIKNGEKTTPEAVRQFNYDGDKLPVCWVNNYAFTAAGIAYSKEEAEAFLWSFDRNDQRPYQWYLVNKELLKPYLGEGV